MRFEWNAIKAEENKRKHRVSFEEACTIFADPLILTLHDENHSDDEDRWVSLGTSALGRVLVVIHTWPDPDESNEEIVRIISARLANKRERAVYLERKRRR